MGRAVDQPPAGGCPERKAVDPTDQVVGRVLAFLEHCDHLVEVADGDGLDAQPSRGHLLHTQGEAGEAAEHPEAADGGVEEVHVLLPAAAPDLSRRQQEVEVQDVVADRANLPVILSVHVHGGASAERGEHRARDHVRPPTLPDDRPTELLDGDARLGDGDAAVGIPGEDAVHVREIEADVPRIQRRVAVALPSTAETDAQACGARGREDLPDLVDRPRPADPARTACDEAPRAHVLPAGPG